MSLRNQPYFPLYVQDFLTDEKLIECSASTTGVYIRLLCILHKSEEYGTILLRQKDQQSDSKIKNFAKKVAKHMPYELEIIEKGLNELVEEGVISIENNKLLQKRMIKDNSISIKRANAGSKGGFAKAKHIAKYIANTEYEYEVENEVEVEVKDEIVSEVENKKTKKQYVLLEETKQVIDYLNKTLGTRYRYTKSAGEEIQARLKDGYTAEDCKQVIDIKSKDVWFINNPKYLRPETLFNPKKFESYINERDKPTTNITSAQMVFIESAKRFMATTEEEDNEEKIISIGNEQIS